MSGSEGREASIRSQIAAIDREITSNYDRAAIFVRDYQRDGDYEGARQYQHRIQERIYDLRCERIELRKLLPPFAIDKNGVLWLQPVTDENKHLLWD